MFQASTSYKILSQEPRDEKIENEFSSSESDGSEDSLDLVLNKIGDNSKRKVKRKYRRIDMARIDGFESYEVIKVVFNRPLRR